MSFTICGSLLRSTRPMYRRAYCTTSTSGGGILQAVATSASSSSTTSTSVPSGPTTTKVIDDGELLTGPGDGSGGGNGTGGGKNSNGKGGKKEGEKESPVRWIGQTPLSDRLHPNQKYAKLDSQKGVEQFLDIGTSAGARRTGRAWRTSELRLKSFEDLHRLWYILLKERNVLLTERAWCKTNGRYWTNGASNMAKVRTSMARVKGVIGERHRAVHRLGRERKDYGKIVDGDEYESDNDDEFDHNKETENGSGNGEFKDGKPSS